MRFEDVMNLGETFAAAGWRGLAAVAAGAFGGLNLLAWAESWNAATIAGAFTVLTGSILTTYAAYWKIRTDGIVNYEKAYQGSLQAKLDACTAEVVELKADVLQYQARLDQYRQTADRELERVRADWERERRQAEWFVARLQAHIAGLQDEMESRGIKLNSMPSAPPVMPPAPEDRR
jgi:hypothetical protein